MIIVLKVVATVFVAVNMRWTYEGFIQKYPQHNNAGGMTAEGLTAAIILLAIWMGGT